MEGEGGGQTPSADPQDELDNLKEMRDMILGCLSDMIQEKKKKILRSLMVVSSCGGYCGGSPGPRSASGVPVSHLCAPASVPRKPRNPMRRYLR